MTTMFKLPFGGYLGVFESADGARAAAARARRAHVQRRAAHRPGARATKPPNCNQPAGVGPARGPALVANRSACRRGPPQHNTANPAAGPHPAARGPGLKTQAAFRHKRPKPGAARATAAQAVRATAAKALQQPGL
jgi:hypothetical protein